MAAVLQTSKRNRKFDNNRIKLNGLVLVLLLTCKNTNAAWTYDDKRILEGPMNSLKILVTKVTSDNETTVIYNISGDYINEFKLDPKSGRIYQISPLDREKKEEYVITATAADANGNPSELPVSFKVTVLDINDNSPVFNKSTLTGVVEESHLIGANSTPFMRIVATDADDGFNGQVVYSIQANSDSPRTSSGNRFAINPNTGDVRLAGYLDYETNPVVRFKVIATDGGGQTNRIKKQAISQVVVHVKDANDHAPNFKPLQKKALSEASPLGRPLYHLHATDEDEGVNEKVYFEIIGGNTGGTFDIISEPDTENSIGHLLLVKKLDFESGITNYLLSIRAFNKEASNADDNAYSTIQTLNVTVTDANEPPVFLHTPYSGTIQEGPAPIEPIPVAQVEAVDLDFGGNQTVTYSLRSASSWFDIHPKTGVVSVIGAVDREAQPVIDGVCPLQVVAADNYDHGQIEYTTVTVDIVIKDINDNGPVPDWGNNKEVVICEKPRNETITVIKAIDLDSAENGPKFSYRFNDSVDTSLWKFEPIDDERQRVVARFSDYGVESAAEKVDLPFTITDSGTVPQTGTATLTVKICKCDEYGELYCLGSYNTTRFPLILAIVACIILICIIVSVVAIYKRRGSAEIKVDREEEEIPTQSLQVHEEEGCEKDNDIHFLPPTVYASYYRRPSSETSICGGSKVEESFDSLFVFDYEGSDSDAGSLSSIDSATTDDDSMNYDYLQDWGPKFKRLADIYDCHAESHING